MTLSLQNLPSELLCQISKACQWGNFDDVSNLRLTCREIYNKTKYHFSQHWFTEIGVHAQPGGLLKLLQVSQSDEHRTYVRQIVLDADFIKQGSLYTDEDSDEENSGQTLDRDVLRFVHEEFYIQLLECISPLENLESITVHQPELQLRLGNEHASQFRYHWTKLVADVLAVIAHHRLRLKEFHVVHTLTRSFPPVATLLDVVSGTPELFGLITNLSLDLCVSQAKYLGYETCALGIIPLLKCATALRELNTSFDTSAAGGRLLSEISRHAGILPTVQTLTLAQLRASSDDLINILRACKDTIRFLKMFEVIVSTGKWSDVSRLMLTDMNVITLDLLRIFESQARVSFRPILRERPYISRSTIKTDLPDTEAVSDDSDDDDTDQIFSDLNNEHDSLPTMQDVEPATSQRSGEEAPESEKSTENAVNMGDDGAEG